MFMVCMQKEKAFPVKIGLEIHGYIDTREKLFCMCRTSSGDSEDVPNSRICPICTGTPGNKPMMPNKTAMDRLIEISLILKCRINHDKHMVWQRKHYDWPDLPKGYQDTISGAYSVSCSEKGKFGGIGITETHLEEDPAQWNPDTGRVNYNRSGLPLIEIVTEPEFSNSDEVIAWLKKLVHSLSYIKAIRRDLGIKVDVNVSTYGDRVEIKNLHSIVDIKHAIDYEIVRQIENHEKGIKQGREALTYDSKTGKTIKMREKESGEDYRFIPDPDLPVLIINEKEIKKVERELPEMPDEKLKKLFKKYEVDKKSAGVLTKHLELVEFFEELARHVDAKKYVSWVTIELLRILNYNKKTLEDEDIDIKPKHLAELIENVDKNKITVLKAKQVMNEFVPKSFSISKKSGVGIVKDNEVERICEKVIKKNKQAVEDFKDGKQEALNFLVGQVMKESERRADFAIAKGCLERMLK